MALFSVNVSWGLSQQYPDALVGTDIVTGGKVTRKFSDSVVTVAVFLSTKCPCSQGHERALKELARTYGSPGTSGLSFQFVGIHSNADESAEEARSYFKNVGFPFEVLQDEGAKIADAFDALKTPHVFVMKGRELVYSGGMDNSHLADHASEFYLKNALDAIVAGRAPEKSSTRTLGCVIKRP